MPGLYTGPMSGKPVRTIALMNQKGGVGKTTTTVNLAASFALAGRSTLVVDLDPQGHATLHLGSDPGTLTRSVYDVLLNPADDPASAIIEVKPNLSLLPAVTDLAAAEIELSAEPDRLQRLEKVFAALNGRYERVAQSVAADHDSLGHALESSHLHVVGLEDIDHRRAVQPR